jgi:hypothetical protein
MHTDRFVLLENSVVGLFADPFGLDLRAVLVRGPNEGSMNRSMT